MSEIVYTAEMADKARAAGVKSQDIWHVIESEVLASHPMRLGVLGSVLYNDRTDRYTVKFDSSDVTHAKLALKASNEVAEYVLAEALGKGSVPCIYGKMDNGTLVSVLLMFVSKEAYSGR